MHMFLLGIVFTHVTYLPIFFRVATLNDGKSVWKLITPTMKRKCHFDEIFIAGCTGSCHFDNFQCSHWWELQSKCHFRFKNDNLQCSLRWKFLQKDISFQWKYNCENDFCNSWKALKPLRYRILEWEHMTYIKKIWCQCVNSKMGSWFVCGTSY